MRDVNAIARYTKKTDDKGTPIALGDLIALGFAHILPSRA